MMKNFKNFYLQKVRKRFFAIRQNPIDFFFFFIFANPYRARVKTKKKYRKDKKNGTFDDAGCDGHIHSCRSK